MSALWWWITGLGATGIIALAVLFFAANALFWIVVQKIASGFMWFFNTRIGFGIVVGMAAWYGTSLYQHHVDQREFDRKTAEFKAQQKQRDSNIAADAKEFVIKQIADEYMAQQESDYEAAQLKTGLSGTGCPIGDDAPILRRFIEVGGTVGSGHKGLRSIAPKKGVPADQRKR